MRSCAELRAVLARRVRDPLACVLRRGVCFATVSMTSKGEGKCGCQKGRYRKAVGIDKAAVGRIDMLLAACDP